MTKTKISTFLTRIRHAAVAAAMTLAASPALAEPATGQPVNWQLGLQPPASPVKEQMEHFHNVLLMPIITFIVIFVALLLLYVAFRFSAKRNPVPSRTTHNTMLEVLWTLVPVIILVIIVVPSMKMLYYADRTAEAEMTLKVTGYQWYWGYEYPDHGDVSFNANMVPEADLKEGQVRLLSTDNVVVLPVDTNIRLLITANDVIHSWAMPALGVKLDAVPGRTNETWTRISREGTFYGQCSEICGINHGFMPIEIKAVSKEEFAKWIETQGGKMPAPADAEAEADGSAAAATPVEADAPAVETTTTETQEQEAGE